ncbi:MAG TPA: 4Fe-4S binding protein [Bacteroides sp.]|nr:4Fe-4S binding protein [Bacteroides sp.]
MEKRMHRRFGLPLAVFLFTSFILAMVQLKVEKPMLLLERFIKGGGWLEIFMIACYGGLVAWQMQDPAKVQAWRKYTWFAFSVLFFSQLTVGLLGAERFLMTGELHLPVPMMILAGPVYRGHISVMTILFLSTVLLSGPAWCSHLCYFGAVDSMASAGRTTKEPFRNKWALKSTVFLLVVAAALALRWMEVPVLTSTLIAGGFGVVGLLLILIVSRREGRMVHCTAYCPIGTIVNVARFVNPFRMRIDRATCTDCMACSRSCKYDALNREDIAAGKPGMTCTLCGDCVASCHAGSIQYRLFRLSPKAARNLYLFITVSLHASTMALARI